MNEGQQVALTHNINIQYKETVDNGEVKASKKKNSFEIRENQFFTLMLMFTNHAPYMSENDR